MLDHRLARHGARSTDRERARQAWRGEANQARHDLRGRRQFVSRWLEESASRGLAKTADQTRRFASELQDAGITRADIRARLMRAIDATLDTLPTAA
jgi:hypothetical protein